MTKIWLLVAAIVLVAACQSGSEPPATRAPSPSPVTVGRWLPTAAPMNVARAYFTATRLLDGRVLIAGGVSDLTVAGTATASTEIYDPSTRQFTAAANMSVGRAGHTATLLGDGTVLVAGGYSQLGEPSHPSAETYDPKTARWSPAPPMHYGRSGQAAVLVAGGKLLIVGGATYAPVGISIKGATPATLPAEIYDPKKLTWSVAGTPTYDRPVDPTATLLGDGRVLVVGGQYMWQSPDESVERSELFDPRTDEWKLARPETVAGARQFQSATMLASGKVLVVGGLREQQPRSAATLYDPRTDSWSSVPDLTEARCGQGTALLQSGRVLMAGSGCNLGDSLGATAEEFDPGTATWHAVAPLGGARGLIVAVPLLDGNVLAVGGITSPVPALTPATQSAAAASNVAEIFVAI